MRYIAKDFLVACEVGLILSGQSKSGKPEWIGTQEKFRRAEKLLERYDGIKINIL